MGNWGSPAQSQAHKSSQSISNIKRIVQWNIFLCKSGSDFLFLSRCDGSVPPWVAPPVTIPLLRLYINPFVCQNVTLQSVASVKEFSAFPSLICVVLGLLFPFSRWQDSCLIGLKLCLWPAPALNRRVSEIRVWFLALSEAASKRGKTNH